MTNRINKTFSALKQKGKTAFVGYLTVGDPDIETSISNIKKAIDNGVDILELGIPFSDPTADGPVIQAASQRALKNGFKINDIFNVISNIRKDYDIPIIIFGYANPFFSYGYEKFASKISECGADGVLVVDLPHEESHEFKQFLNKKNVSFINLIAPTTTKERAKEILDGASGFVYYIMVTGVTGMRTTISSDIDEHISMLNNITDLPIAAGFGVSNGPQAINVANKADGVVVGSALIKASLSNNLETLVKEIRTALDSI